MESKKLQKAIGLYIISEMKKENTLNVAQFTLLRRTKFFFSFFNLTLSQN